MRCAVRRILAVELLESRCLLAVFTVTTTADAGPGSLRQAILDVNTLPGEDRIEFAIARGVQTIRPLSLLPAFTEAVVLDATTQPGYQGTPLIELDGSQGTSMGLRVSGPGGSTVRGLAINRFTGSGISVGDGNFLSRFNHIVGNFIGTDVTGTVALPNSGAGVRVFGNDNRIGGTAPEDRNLIAGNLRGVELTWSRNVVQGNFIGTDITGTKSLGNRVGIVLSRIRSTFASDNLIGGTEPGAGNLIAGNTQQGIVAGADVGTSVSGTVIQGNLIGTDVSGTNPLGNGSDGLGLGLYATGTRAGSLEPGAGNVIAFNGGNGIVLQHGRAQGNVIYGNTGAGIIVSSWSANQVQSNWVVGNGASGIYVYFYPSTSGRTLIGGADQAQGNFVAYNGGTGIVVDRGVRNTLSGNMLIGNAGPGIELRNGGNNDQAAPHVAGAFTFGRTLLVGGWLFSPPAQRFAVEFFASPDCDDSGAGEGEHFLGSRKTETDADGLAMFIEALDAEIPAGWAVTATATDALGNTSAFSACAVVQDAGGAPGGGLGDVLAALLAGEVRTMKRSGNL